MYREAWTKPTNLSGRCQLIQKKSVKFPAILSKLLWINNAIGSILKIRLYEVNEQRLKEIYAELSGTGNFLHPNHVLTNGEDPGQNVPTERQILGCLISCKCAA